MSNAFRDDVLAGKVVFIAGASSGINLGIAQHFARAGARLALVSRDPERIAAAAATINDAGGSALGMAADVRDYAAVEAALARTRDELGPIDIVISGAAGNFVAPALGMSANGFKTVVDIDLIGTFNVFRASFAFLNAPGASLIAITAPQAVNAMMFQAHVCAAKAGINMLVKCLAMEWGAAGVRVNGISPGPIAGTEGMARLAPTPEMEARFKGRLALRDYGDKSDIANTALFLCTDNARYITGTIVDCDGGSKLGDASADALRAPQAPQAPQVPGGAA
jgi:NAD(P)-dependent dehydrogenase (short-subunit alcohol dehydrogenase family)